MEGIVTKAIRNSLFNKLFLITMINMDDISPKELTVSQAIDYLNGIIKPQRILVVGEIGEKVSSYPYGSYFNLLDHQEKAVLGCLIWRASLDNSNVELKKGERVVVLGHPEIYKGNGSIKLIVENISVVGEGKLKKAFEELKKKLKEKGFFELERKRVIKRFPKKIGLITSRYGQGARPDFIKHLANFGLTIYFYDVRVEGLMAINDISKAVHWLNRNIPDLDVIALIRGGGSYESLQPFNSEEVAKAIFSSKIPIICGIGHEKDETIAGLTADVRASTPTDAAKILSRNWEMASINISEQEKNITALTKGVIREFNAKIRNMEINLSEDMDEVIKDKQAIIKEKVKDFLSFSEVWLKKGKDNLRQQAKMLRLSNPELKFKQGYSLTLDESGKVLKNVDEIEIGQIVKTRFYKGQILSQVKQKNGK